MSFEKLLIGLLGTPLGSCSMYGKGVRGFCEVCVEDGG